jgi:hypothetical protein
MRRFRVTWWISGAGRIGRGSDVVPFLSTMTEADANNLMEADLSKIREEEEYELKLPNFCAKHHDLTCASHHSEVSNFGILRVVELKG